MVDNKLPGHAFLLGSADVAPIAPRSRGYRFFMPGLAPTRFTLTLTFIQRKVIWRSVTGDRQAKNGSST